MYVLIAHKLGKVKVKLGEAEMGEGSGRSERKDRLGEDYYYWANQGRLGPPCTMSGPEGEVWQPRPPILGWSLFAVFLPLVFVNG